MCLEPVEREVHGANGGRTGARAGVRRHGTRRQKSETCGPDQRRVPVSERLVPAAGRDAMCFLLLPYRVTTSPVDMWRGGGRARMAARHDAVKVRDSESARPHCYALVQGREGLKAGRLTLSLLLFVCCSSGRGGESDLYE